MDISGRRILLTGASGGLGHAIARDLARHGAHLVLTARNASQLAALATEVSGEVMVADLDNREDLERVVAEAANCDVLIANAGIGGDRGLDEMTTRQVDSVIDVNLRAPILLAGEFGRAHLAAGTPGHIVFIGSLSALSASPRTRLYNATKFGLRGFALALRQDLHGTGIGVSVIEPGFIRDAGMFANNEIQLPPGVRTKTPQDVAQAVTKSIRRDLGEVFVAPIEMRFASILGGFAPGLGAAVQRMVGAADRVP